MTCAKQNRRMFFSFDIQYEYTYVLNLRFTNLLKHNCVMQICKYNESLRQKKKNNTYYFVVVVPREKIYDSRTNTHRYFSVRFVFGSDVNNIPHW